MNLFDKIRDTVGAMFGSEHREDEGEQLIAPIDPFARGLDYTKLIETARQRHEAFKRRFF